MKSSKLIELGGNEWKKNGMKRIYITNEILNILRAEKDLGEVSYGERNNKIFFDVSLNAVMRSYKGKKPAVEIQY
jgi:hypothetical protein